MTAIEFVMGYDFEGTFTLIKKCERNEFALGDDRQVTIAFSKTPKGI
jgi:hypothetical protein